ncbi:hypothetical protein HYH03_007032 [Edaphochlamys debaryana]|uniref:Uncharacterized protein n=1 Tax=Edaphochlamys debaryana TaxID=47281 RepID=A0A835Y407_9CHLO|nr:hypothetical protein HYH03_007032 [Edaphochlamys debaryana]|eukprot:KAG2494789.1 hypothetical protein HYH03_007032 [Edaphochlamys debaryana]
MTGLPTAPGGTGAQLASAGDADTPFDFINSEANAMALIMHLRPTAAVLSRRRDFRSKPLAWAQAAPLSAPSDSGGGGPADSGGTGSVPELSAEQVAGSILKSIAEENTSPAQPSTSGAPPLPPPFPTQSISDPDHPVRAARAKEHWAAMVNALDSLTTDPLATDHFAAPNNKQAAAALDAVTAAAAKHMCAQASAALEQRHGQGLDLPKAVFDYHSRLSDLYRRDCALSGHVANRFMPCQFIGRPRQYIWGSDDDHRGVPSLLGDCRDFGNKIPAWAALLRAAREQAGPSGLLDPGLAELGGVWVQTEPPAVQVLRAAHRGVLWLLGGGAVQAEGGRLSPLACAALVPLVALLLPRGPNPDLDDGMAPRDLTPDVLYDILAYGPLPPAAAPSPVPGACACSRTRPVAPAAGRYSAAHLEHVLVQCSSRPVETMARAALHRAVAHGACAEVLRRRATHCAALEMHWACLEADPDLSLPCSSPAEDEPSACGAFSMEAAEAEAPAPAGAAQGTGEPAAAGSGAVERVLMEAVEAPTEEPAGPQAAREQGAATEAEPPEAAPSPAAPSAEASAEVSALLTAVKAATARILNCLAGASADPSPSAPRPPHAAAAAENGGGPGPCPPDPALLHPVELLLLTGPGAEVDGPHAQLLELIQALSYCRTADCRTAEASAQGLRKKRRTETSAPASASSGTSLPAAAGPATAASAGAVAAARTASALPTPCGGAGARMAPAPAEASSAPCPCSLTAPKPEVLTSALLMLYHHIYTLRRGGDEGSLELGLAFLPALDLDNAGSVPDLGSGSAGFELVAVQPAGEVPYDPPENLAWGQVLERYKIVVSGRGESSAKGLAAQMRPLREALLTKRLGSAWLDAVGVEGVARAMQMAVQLRSEVQAQEGPGDLAMAIVDISLRGVHELEKQSKFEPNQEPHEERQSGLGLGYALAVTDRHAGFFMEGCLQTVWDCVGALLSLREAALRDGPEDAVEVGSRAAERALATGADALRRLDAALRRKGHPLREGIRVTIRLVECEPGSPARLVVPPGARVRGGKGAKGAKGSKGAKAAKGGGEEDAQTQALRRATERKLAELVMLRGD